MEITINYNGRLVTVEVSVEVAECLEEGRKKKKISAMNSGGTGMTGYWTST